MSYGNYAISKLAGILANDRDWTIVGEATDGEDAVSKAEQLRPELVLMIWICPASMDSRPLGRSRALFPKTVVVMFSSLDGPAFREAAARCGGSESLCKLDPLPKIINTIRESS